MKRGRELMKISVLVLVVAVGLVAAPLEAGWVPTGSMDAARVSHYGVRGVSLPDGRVMFVSGWRRGAIYDPFSREWSVTAPMRSERSAAVVALQDGLVFVAGGIPSRDTSEYYDADLDSWNVGPRLNASRVTATGTVLQDGRVLIVGGGTQNETAEICSLREMTCVPTNRMVGARTVHSATLLPDGRVLVAGGGYHDFRSAEIFNPVTNAWYPTADMLFPRAAHSSVLLVTGQVLVVGGDYSASARTTELFDPQTESWSQAGDLLVARQRGHGVTILADGTALVAGAENGIGDYSRTAEVFDYTTNTWTQIEDMGERRGNPLVILLWDGTVLVAGGYFREECGGIGEERICWQEGTPSAELYFPPYLKK